MKQDTGRSVLRDPGNAEAAQKSSLKEKRVTTWQMRTGHIVNSCTTLCAAGWWEQGKRL